jgi:hypothetical protein
MKDALEELSGLSPIDFFNLSLDVPYFSSSKTSKLFRKSHILPDTSELLGEESFAEIAMGWSEEGLFFEAFIKKPFDKVLYPEFRKGDSLELLIDTRDLKTAGFVTKFCHHFLILPKEIEGEVSQEITHFRTEDAHVPCDASDIKVEASFDRKDYRLKIFLPSHCLHGYDPASFDRIGFTYRINRFEGEAQHFSVSSDEFVVEQNPSLWSSIKLIK